MSGELAFAVQSARGTPAAASTQRTPLISGTIEPAYSVNANPELRTGRIGGAPWIPAAAGGVRGEPAIIVRPKMIGLLLYAALGTKAVSGSSPTWTHTFTLGTSLPWLTIWRHVRGVLNERFSDVRISRLTLSGKAGGLVTARIAFEGASTAYRTAQETAVAVETDDYVLHRHGAGALLVEGSSFSTISEWTLSIDTGVRLVPSLAGPIPRLSGKATIGLQINHRVSDAALWRRMIYGTSSPANLAAPATGPLTLAGSPVGVQFTFTVATSPERSLRLALPQVALGPIDGLEPGREHGPIELRTSLFAYAPSAGSAITATLKNGQASY